MSIITCANAVAVHSKRIRYYISIEKNVHEHVLSVSINFAFMSFSRLICFVNKNCHYLKHEYMHGQKVLNIGSKLPRIGVNKIAFICNMGEALPYREFLTCRFMWIDPLKVLEPGIKSKTQLFRSGVSLTCGFIYLLRFNKAQI